MVGLSMPCILTVVGLGCTWWFDLHGSDLQGCVSFFSAPGFAYGFGPRVISMVPMDKFG